MTIVAAVHRLSFPQGFAAFADEFVQLVVGGVELVAGTPAIRPPGNGSQSP